MKSKYDLDEVELNSIPEGYYCYSWIETPSKENNFRGKVKSCPYYKGTDENEGMCKLTHYSVFDWCKECGIKE